MSIYENIPVSDDKLTDEATRSPEILFNSSVAEEDEVKRDTGLILTKEQIKNIKRYEIVGLSLPVELKDVITYLGYETGAGRGLEAADFKITFTQIHGHASLWNPLRTDLLAVGSTLRIFAGNMKIYGNSMKEVYEDIRAMNVLDDYNIQTLEDVRKLELSMGSKFPGIQLDKQDKETAQEFSHYLDNILQAVKAREAEAQEIKQRLDAFGFELASRIGPAVKLKIAAINNSDLSDRVKELNEIIDTRATTIDEKNREYKEAVKQAVGSAGSLNIVGLALAIYIGVQAENIRKELKVLRDQQNRDIEDMRTKNRIIASLNRVRLDLQNLDTIVIDADIATKNLITVWNSLTLFVEHSSNAVDTIDDALSLRRFHNNFQLVVSPWEDIREEAKLLHEVFSEADEEFRAEYNQGVMV